MVTLAAADHAQQHAKHRRCCASSGAVTYGRAWRLLCCQRRHRLLLLLVASPADAAGQPRLCTRPSLGGVISLDRVLHLRHVPWRTATAFTARAHGSGTHDRQRRRDGSHRRLVPRDPCRQGDGLAHPRSGLEPRLRHDERPRLCALRPRPFPDPSPNPRSAHRPPPWPLADALNVKISNSDMFKGRNGLATGLLVSGRAGAAPLVSPLVQVSG